MDNKNAAPRESDVFVAAEYYSRGEVFSGFRSSIAFRTAEYSHHDTQPIVGVYVGYEMRCPV